jgi:YD repeat-containing protein
MKKIIGFSVLVFAIGICLGQGSTVNRPKILPASPTAQTFIRYGEIPVDYSTGVPRVEVPIYTVEGRQLKVPLSVSYHGSGIKVNDIPSEVGLGWALNAGGMIARTINGIADETRTATRTFHSAAELLDSVYEVAGVYNSTCACYLNIQNFESYFNSQFEAEDPASDRYFYRLPNGASGVYTYDYLNSGNAISLPYRPLKITKYESGSGPSAKIDSLLLTDENGVKYLFGSFLSSWPRSYSEWYLKRMVSADGTDTIRFFYSSQTGHTYANNSFTLSVHAQDVGSNCAPDGTSYSNISGSLSPVMAFNTPVLDSITSSKVVVRLLYNTREDFGDLRRLTQITVSPVKVASDPIRTVQFYQRYFGTTTADKRLGLDSIGISAPGGIQPQVYSFSYESQVLPPYPSKMTYPVYSEDFWGYYNGAGSPNLIPADFARDADKPYCGNRYPDVTGYYSKACMLTEIKYPTGGKTVFEFERNYADNLYPYKTGDQGGYAGGFRIGSIKTYNSSGEAADTRSYEYSGVKTKPVTKELFSFINQGYDRIEYISEPEGWSLYCWRHSMDTLLLSDPLLPLEVAPGMPVMYETVTEYNGTAADNVGKTEYKYNAPYSASDYLNDPSHPTGFELPWYYSAYNYDKGNYVPELIQKKVFARSGSTYQCVSMEKYEYSKLFTTTFQTGIKLTRPEINVKPGIVGGPLLGSDYAMSLVAVDTKAYREASLLTSSQNYLYNQTDAASYILVSTDYTYNGQNLSVQQKKMLSSKGDTLKTVYEYPSDFAGVGVYDELVSRNVLSPVIKESDYKNSIFLRSTKNNYDFWNGNAWITTATNMVVTRTSETQVSGNPVEVRLRYHSYDDKSNPTSVSKEADVKTSYIWAYNQNYPIAEVMNAEAKDIFHTSFEEGDGNRTAGDSKTGKKSKTDGYSKILTGLADQSYILSYWTKSAGSWTFNSTTTAVTGGTYNISIGGQVDEVRFYPATAQMVTMTYDPPIGVTSQCDAKNRITYYEYDQLGRLIQVRDHDGNIIKTYQYVYKTPL